MDPLRIMGKNVTSLREAIGLSQTDLAGRLGARHPGVTQAYLSELEAGKRNPTFKTLVAIAEALNAPVEQVVEGASVSKGKRTRISKADET